MSQIQGIPTPVMFVKSKDPVTITISIKEGGKAPISKEITKPTKQSAINEAIAYLQSLPK